MNIPAGYQLHIKTWENDLDACKTQVISGLEEADVIFLIELASKFKSKNNWDDPGLGNNGVNSHLLDTTVKELYDKYKDVLSPFVKNEYLTESISAFDEVNEDDYDEYSILYDWLCDTVLGWPEDQYYLDIFNFCRVFDSYEVYFIPMEIENVTSKFKYAQLVK